MKLLPISKHFLIAFSLCVITLLAFLDVIKGHMLWGSDFIVAYLPYKEFLYEEIQKHCSIPLWNPYLFGGMPFWAFFESTIFYPLDLLFWFITPEKAYGYTMALHILLAGISMYTLCHTLRLSKGASLFAAIMFSYNSFIMPVLSLGRMVHVQSYCWTPMVLCLFVKALESKRPFSMALCTGLCWGLQILAADPQTAFYTYGALTLFALVHYGVFSSRKRCLTALMVLFVVFVFGFGISAIQVVPAMELVRFSTRGILRTYDLVTLASFPPQGIITILMPHFFGNLYDNNFWITNVPWSMPEFNLYVGVLPLLLIPFIRFRPFNDKRLPLFCIILALIAIVLAMGKHTPVYKLAYLLPGFDSFRAPSKIIVLWMLAISLLAGNGMDDLISSRGEKVTWRWFALITIAILLIFLDIWLFIHPENSLHWFSCFLLKSSSPELLANASQIIQSQFHRFASFLVISMAVSYLGFKGFLSRRIWVMLFLSILFMDIAIQNRLYIKIGDEYYERMKKDKASLTRIFKQDIETFRVGVKNSRYGPNAEMYLGLQTPAGSGPLILFRYYTYSDHFYNKISSPGWAVLKYGTPGSGKFMEMLNVKYEIDHKNGIITTRKNYLPRALCVSESKVLPESKMLSYMESSDFDPRKTVLFKRGFSPEHSLHTSSYNIKKDTGSCKILSYQPNIILINAIANRETFLVLNDIYYPGWKCYVDGIEEKIYTCNYLFRAIKLKKGTHNVRFIFRPPLVIIGTLITIITLLLCLLFMIFRKLTLKKRCNV
ncbi:MAG: YfhO family protein [Thermodesulfobacteriota bacterium]|nr:YfhO family protein [Thermodesulfobacteriota bacterium]